MKLIKQKIKDMIAGFLKGSFFPLSIFLFPESVGVDPSIDSPITIDPEVVYLIYFTCMFLVNFFSFLYLVIKFYKILCYAKLTCEWFPMLNPYQWPFSFLRTMTRPYFKFWSRILPSLRFKKSSIDISGIVALEALNALIYFCVRGVNILLIILHTSEKTLNIIG